ncbi:hypothetical protein [Sphingomonas aurantiaca]|jgi:hypothetical protein
MHATVTACPPAPYMGGKRNLAARPVRPGAKVIELIIRSKAR